MRDPMAIFDAAVKAHQDKDFHQALEFFVELHELELEENSMYHALRRSHGIVAWILLGKEYAPAKARLFNTLLAKERIIDERGSNPTTEADIAAIKNLMLKIN